MDDDLLFDAVVTRTLAEPATLIDGLDAHEGATVWADVDGWIEGPFVVAEGTITLPHAGSGGAGRTLDAAGGRDAAAGARSRGRQVLRRPARVHHSSGRRDRHVDLRRRQRPPASDVTLARFGDPADQPFAGRDGGWSRPASPASRWQPGHDFAGAPGRLQVHRTSRSSEGVAMEFALAAVSSLASSVTGALGLSAAWPR